jgi:phosphomannomutase
MEPLIVSYSGIRGIVGSSLTPAVAARYAHAFGELMKERYAQPNVLVARDTRPSGPALTAAALAALAPFAELVDLGVVPTPTLQVAMGALGAQGGLCITASHNPRAWNGMKFFIGPDNIVLDAEQIRTLAEIASRAAPATAVVTPPEKHDEAVAAHVDRVLAHVDASAIRARGFRVALDAGGGAGAAPTRALLEALGCEVVMVDADRESEPLAEHLGELCRVVVEARCDVGFAQDLDADRLALVDERGEPPGEEHTLVLVIDHLLSRHAEARCTVVKNVVTTRAVDDVARAHGAALVETRVGEVNLSRALIDESRRGRAAFGGEGNGGVIFPPVAFGRDSLSGAALVLAELAIDGHSLSARIAALPRYHMRKTALACHLPFDDIVARAAAIYPTARANRNDGLKMELPDGSWFSLRMSNTEPVIRITAESPSATWPDHTVERLSELCG